MKKLIKWGLIGFLGLIVLGMLGSSGSKEKSSSVEQSTPKEEQTGEVQLAETVKVSMQEFIAEFDKNQLSAEEKYEGKIVELSAYIDNISEDILGSPFLKLKPTSQEYYFETGIQCFFEDKSELISLENGQKVTIRGEFDAQSLGNILIKECEVIE